MIAPLLIADYQSGKLDVNSRQFRIITAFASLFALLVPIFGANPIKGQLLTQVFNVFVLPLVIIGIILPANNKKLMGKYKNRFWVNTGLGWALFFSPVISYNGVIAIINY